MAHVTLAPTLSPSLRPVVLAALEHSLAETADVAIRITRHGIRRAFFRSCPDRGCPLVATRDDYAEAGVGGRGHLYARRRDLGSCRTDGAITPVDRTSHWVTGRAYDGVPYPRAVPRGTRYLVTIKVPQVVPDDLFPAERTYHRAKTAGPTAVGGSDDDLVFVLGHELHHVHQFRHDLPRSEVEAELAGRGALQRWVAAGRPGGG